MLLAFLQAYWWAPVVSLSAFSVQCTQPRPEIALMLHALTALAWGIPLACLWGQTRTALGECNDVSGPFDTLAPVKTPEPRPRQNRPSRRHQILGIPASDTRHGRGGSGAYH